MSDYNELNKLIDKEFMMRKQNPSKQIIIEIYDEKEKFEFFIEKIKVCYDNIKNEYSLGIDIKEKEINKFKLFIFD